MATHDKPPTCPDSEFSWGEGMFPHPAIDFDQGKTGAANINHRTQEDMLRDRAAIMRSNVMDANETLEELYFAKGNPDRFGPHPPLVQQKAPKRLSPKKLEPVTTFQREE